MAEAEELWAARRLRRAATTRMGAVRIAREAGLAANERAALQRLVAVHREEGQTPDAILAAARLVEIESRSDEDRLAAHALLRELESAREAEQDRAAMSASVRRRLSCGDIDGAVDEVRALARLELRRADRAAAHRALALLQALHAEAEMSVRRAGKESSGMLRPDDNRRRYSTGKKGGEALPATRKG
jgi:hypothetical protein